MNENAVETRLVKNVKKAGGLIYKFTSPGNRGVPDRIVIHQGRVYFIELKRPKGGKIAELQKYEHERISRHGGHALFITNYTEVDEFCLKLEAIKKLEEGK